MSVTRFEGYALDAFTVNSIDYLLKPIEPGHLDRALTKVERLSTTEPPPDVRALLTQITSSLGSARSPWLERIVSKTGDRVEPVDLRRVTHFLSKDKLTYAATPERSYIVDMTIADLEQKLDPRRFIRIHRGTILNLDHLLELHSMFGGRMVGSKTTRRRSWMSRGTASLRSNPALGCRGDAEAVKNRGVFSPKAG